MSSVHFYQPTSVFHGKILPEVNCTVVGYAIIIDVFNLEAPMPDIISVISTKNRKYSKDGWHVFPNSYQPEDSIYKQLVFALKYEGINLLVLKKLFEKLSQEKVEDVVNEEPAGQYALKIWFLYEWLMSHRLDLPDADKKIKYKSLLDDKLQFSVPHGIKSARHRVINNLLGNVNFCPTIRKTEKLEQYIIEDLAGKQKQFLQGIRKDVLQRASAFLMLKDSKASFTIEGESPKSKRAARWGQAIGQAGVGHLSKEELLRLQQLVIENPRFLDMGYRRKGGFVGEHDNASGEPLPDHISAKWEDLDELMEGLLDTDKLLLSQEIDAVLSAAVIAFGFVFIHPFEDGNGRIHRYLVHHVLAKKKFTQQGIIFPVSAAILNRMDDYRKVLEHYSLPLLDFIEWQETVDHNVEIVNDTNDYYRYFDATVQAEFLYECVEETIKKIIPSEVDYLTKYEIFKNYLEDKYEMPDRLVATVTRFLEQNNGRLSKRVREKELQALDDPEALDIEKNFQQIFWERFTS